ncbi:MAG: hypothetical protein IJ060_06300 [Oscillospiraceae bacterium]|nr:hypothetical protein [Oscillospiraceae bacterium]
MRSDKKAYVSPHNPDVMVLPADPKAVQEAHEQDASRMSVKSELLDLYRKLSAARIKLEEDDRIIDLILQQRNQIAAEIADMEQRVQELEERKI